MKEVNLLLTVLVMFIVCFFVMGKIGYFINENYKAFIIEERENTQSCKIISFIIYPLFNLNMETLFNCLMLSDY